MADKDLMEVVFIGLTSLVFFLIGPLYYIDLYKICTRIKKNI